MNTQSKTTRVLFTPAVVLALMGAASAQDIPAVIVAGDTVPLVAGSIASFDSVDVNNSGAWLIEARTDTPHQVLVSSAGLVGQEGDALPSPPMATITTWDGSRLNNLGDMSHNILISGVESTLYWNGVFQLAEGDFATAAEFTPGSPYLDFREAWVNDANQMMVVGSLDDPNLGLTNFDSFLMVRDLDASGAVLSENVVVKTDDVLPGMTGIQKVENVHANGNHQYAINNSGDVIYGVRIRGVILPNTNDAYYINDTTLLAREGEVEPLTGRVWKTLSGSIAMDINDSGDYAYRGRLDAPGSGDWIIIKNNSTIIAQEGESIPAIAPHTFREFTSALPSTGPVLIDNAGNVLWFGEWEDAMGVSQGRALFLNQEILVQEGVATSGGSSIFIDGDEFAMSDTGQFILFSGRTGGTFKVFLMNQSEFGDLCFGDGGNQMGCTNCPCGNNMPQGTIGGCLNSGGASARLLPSGVPSIASDSLHFELSGAPANAFCILNSGDSVAPGNMANPCFGMDSGAQAAVFDGLRCAITNTRRHGGRGADSNGDVGQTNNGWGPPNGPMIGFAAQSGWSAGQTRYFQVINRDDPLAICMRGLNTSQAISVTYFP